MLKLYTALSTRFAALRDREEGQTMAEYGVILVLIAVAAVAIIGTLGGDIVSAFQRAVNAI